MRGYSLIDVLAVVAILMTVLGIAIPQIDRTRDRSRTWAAVHFLSGELARSRFQAVHRSRRIGVRFKPSGDTFLVRRHADGNDNGVRLAETESGVDPPLADAFRIEDLFPGVRFGFVEGCPLIDGSPGGGSPVRLGNTTILTFSPSGTATSGTLYVRGRGATQWALVVLGATGRTRILRCDAWSGTWTPG